MIIKATCQEGRLFLKFTVEKGDPISHHKFSSSYKKQKKVLMSSMQCEIRLPSDWTITNVHPDLFALAMLATIYPFAGNVIRLPFGVSQYFHDQVLKFTKKKMVPINKKLSRRKAPTNAVPALTFSGGIDSTAAVALLPENTHLIYFDRIVPKGTKTLLNQEAAYYACDEMKKLNKTVHKIQTDLQYLRKPVGFSTFLTDAVPALLLADYYDYDALANGHTLDLGYRVGHLGYEDCLKTELAKPWHPLLKAVDMPYTLPTIGLSEVITTNIVRQSPFAAFAQACSRGKIKKPCMNCYKCFRKSLLEKVLTKQPITDQFLDDLFEIKDVKRVLATKHLHYGNVITFITAHYQGKHPEMLALKNKTRGDRLDVSWMNKWYPASQVFLAPKYRQEVKKLISKYVKPMSKKDIQEMKQSFGKAYFNK